MDKKHPDLAAINRVGTRAICDHFAITRQSLHHWRKVGVPKQYRKSLIALGESLGHDMSDLRIALSVEALKVRGIPPRAADPVGNWRRKMAKAAISDRVSADMRPTDYRGDRKSTRLNSSH